MTPNDIDKEKLQYTLHQLLRAWPNAKPDILADLERLRIYRQFAAQFSLSTAQPVSPVRNLLEMALETLAQQNPDAATLLQQRFINGAGVRAVAQQLAVSESQFYMLQNQALTALTKVVLEREQQARSEYHLAVEMRLEPLPHQQLFGVGGLKQQLKDVVTAPNSPWLISIEGLGGIGKTSIADWLVRELIVNSPFFDVGWVSARQHTFHPAVGLTSAGTDGDQPVLSLEMLIDKLLVQMDQPHVVSRSENEKTTILGRLFKQNPYLVVIDNLETVADYQQIVRGVRRWINPSKFVFTSRYSLRAYTDVYCLTLTELNQADTLAFLRHQAENRQLAGLAQASTEQLVDIFNVVGGNPLALKLVLGQIHILSLEQVLENLKLAQGQKITDLYTHIYWQSWKALGDAGRQALLSLPLASSRGSNIEHLLAVSGLGVADLSQALDELTACSLVEVGGGLNERRYSIHRLTETFLMTEVARWQ